MTDPLSPTPRPDDQQTPLPWDQVDTTLVRMNYGSGGSGWPMLTSESAVTALCDALDTARIEFDRLRAEREVIRAEYSEELKKMDRMRVLISELRVRLTLTGDDLGMIQFWRDADEACADDLIAIIDRMVDIEEWGEVPTISPKPTPRRR